MSRIALKRLEPHSDSSLAVLTAPIKPLHILSDQTEDKPPMRRPAPGVATIAPERAFASTQRAMLRRGAQPAKGASTLLFFVVIALVVLTMSVVGLALGVPAS